MTSPLTPLSDYAKHRGALRRQQILYNGTKERDGEREREERHKLHTNPRFLFDSENTSGLPCTTPDIHTHTADLLHIVFNNSYFRNFIIED